jgi:hypothetical protein
VLFMSTTTATRCSGYQLACARKPSIAPPCAIIFAPRGSFATEMPIPYRVGVPSASVDAVVISVYDFGESTLPPCSACSHATMSPADEQSEPAE